MGTSSQRVVRKLGEGGMGVVYALHDERLNRPVALKRIRLGLTDANERQRFWREARAASSVNHPNVCQLYEEVIHHTHRVIDSGFADPEVFYHWAGALASAGDHDGALGLLERAIAGGFHPAAALERDRRFDPLRALGDFRQAVRQAEELQREALAMFVASDGPRLLGLAVNVAD